MRRRLTVAGLVFGFLLIVFLSGPRVDFGSEDIAPHTAVPPAIDQLEDWLARREAAFPDLRPGTAKGIVWGRPSRQRTPWAVVYVHGFSATRLETAPLADRVAGALGANLYYARLTGHGLPGEAMGQASVQDWLADTLEAVRVGRQLGERVLLVSCSTGSTLATWLALQPEGKDVAAHVFISPNFGPKDKRADIANWPWGRQIVRWVQGPWRSSPVNDPREAVGWTNPYPTEAIFPMMALVKRVRESDLARVDRPVLMLYADGDKTVEPEQTKAAFARIGAAGKTLEAVTYSKARGQHVLAGDIMAPEATAPMAERIVRWVRALPVAP